MRVLITGSTGLLGCALQTEAGADKQLYGIFHPARPLPRALRASQQPADVTSMPEMRRVFEWARPDVVIHAAAIGSVDFAEKHPAQTHAVNVGGTAVVAECCKDFGARLIYISSNAVFDGTQPLYSETDPVSPINYYGRLKVEAEQVAAASGVPHAIVRPILMYGWPYPEERGNLVTTWVKALREHQPQSVVENVFSKPLPAQACADAVWAIVNRNLTGIYHVAGADHVSLHQFALAVAAAFALDPALIQAVPDSFFPQLAPRPRDTSFNTNKMEKELGLHPVPLASGLQQMKAGA